VVLLLGKGYESADDWAALLLQDLSCLMLILFSDPLGEIMDEHVHDLIEKIRATSNQVEGIIDTENASSVKGNEISCGLACDR
jgi:hypothetical protein